MSENLLSVTFERDINTQKVRHIRKLEATQLMSILNSTDMIEGSRKATIDLETKLRGKHIKQLYSKRVHIDF